MAMTSRRGSLYLLPAPLGATTVEDVLPRGAIETARRIDYFLAENAKSARALLKAIGHPRPIAEIRIVEIGHAPEPGRIGEWLKPLLDDGADAAIVSEAGCPGVADPGAGLVAGAHEIGIAVHPLIGPSSILLGLMASGLNGQRFRFVGYLPREAAPLSQRLRELERDSRHGETQMFIETPYRNQRLLAALLETCKPTTRLSLAVDLTTADEHIAMRTISDWLSLPLDKRPRLDRHPAVFSLLAVPEPAGNQPRVRAAGSGRQ